MENQKLQLIKKFLQNTNQYLYFTRGAIHRIENDFKTN